MPLGNSVSWCELRHFQDKREVLFGDGTMNGLPAELGALAWKIAYERWSDTANGYTFLRHTEAGPCPQSGGNMPASG